MKNYYLLLFLLLGVFGKAQIITIPNANFKAKLLAASPSNTIAQDLAGYYFKIDANNNGEIETSEALNVGYLDIESSMIQSLDGILNFTNLIALRCQSNQLTSLNVSGLVNLTHLYCQSNQLSSLNVSGVINLASLHCYMNQLTSLNVSGLTNLTEFSCYTNQLTSLNVSGTTNLNVLNCENNDLTSLDVSGLVNLTQLGCNSNQLTSLNVNGTTNLAGLYCSGNQLTSLNVSGLTNLTILSCSANQLTSINLNGTTNLTDLTCGSNQLTSLNVNGLVNLTKLRCDHNQLTSLNIGELVNLTMLHCGNNQFPVLDVSNLYSLYSLDFDNNNQLALLFIKNGINNSPFFMNTPNLTYICADEEEITSINQHIQNFILFTNPTFNCQVNSYCSFTPGGQFYTIQAQNKFDNENDGCDINDDFIPNLKYSATNGTTTSVFSNNTGNYSIPVLAGTNTVAPIFENLSYFNVSPANIVVNFPAQASPFTQNFCITPNGTKHDVEVSIVPINNARPGFDANYKIIYKNKGNQVESGTINLQFDDSVLDLVSTNPVFTTQTINNLNWTYSNLEPFETRSIIVVCNVNSPMETPAVNAGDFLIFSAEITQFGLDEVLSDNSFGLKQIVVNSFDPNDKTCLEGNTISPDKIGNYVHYVIRFENTGTFPAENIVVKDMIDTTKFDVSSLVPLHASHNYVTKITGNKIEFIFENINLPFDDANNDGYVAFKIKTVPTLVTGNSFSNSANIYFDYNFPIVTNTATTNIVALSNPSFEFATYFSLYPNPATNELNINLKSAVEINSIQIYNSIGQLVTVQTGNALKVDVSNLKTGNYFIKINTKEGYTTSQFIKE